MTEPEELSYAAQAHNRQRDHTTFYTWKVGPFTHLKTFTDVTCVNRDPDKNNPLENPQRAVDGQLVPP